ncbi:hypothetical protein SLA2020_200370 [Shorea laevis]
MSLPRVLCLKSWVCLPTVFIWRFVHASPAFSPFGVGGLRFPVGGSLSFGTIVVMFSSCFRPIGERQTGFVVWISKGAHRGLLGDLCNIMEMVWACKGNVGGLV